MEEHTIEYSNKTIKFQLDYKNIKNMNISVKPDQTIYVSAPLNATYDRVETFVKAKARWILKQQSHFKATKKMDDSKKEYVSGETLKYLGAQYRLKVLGNKEKEFVEIDDKYLIVHTKKKKDITRKQRLVNAWVRKEAFNHFNKALNEMCPLVENIVKSKPQIEVKKMTKRWGSCLRKKNTILLNLELIKAPMHCIEYVVLHELIHFKHKNHNKTFYDKLTVIMPDWKRRKEILDEEVVLFI
jgi:predicted metal-dependent hydrolase